MADDRNTSIEPVPDLRDIPVKPAPDPAEVERNADLATDDEDDTPEDLTLPAD